jgi:peptide deformylase
MTILQIIQAPNNIFKQKAKEVSEVTDTIRNIANDMIETMYFEEALGLGANMVGVDHQIIVLDLKENNIKKPYIMINPKIIKSSAELSKQEEASISFPGISAIIERPSEIIVRYLDMNNEEQTLEADGLLARVILHEIDYLHGVVFIDYLSKLKKDMLIKKMLKFIKHNPPHIHGAHCNH